MNLVFKILKLIKIFSKAKFSIKKPKKKKFLIYDISGSSEILKYLPKNDTFVLSVRGEVINLRIFLLSILKFKFKWKFSQYLVFFIEKVNPDIIITFIDNNPEFYKLKKFFQDKKTIFIQNGIRGYDNDVFGLFEKNLIDTNQFHVDEMFVWNEKTGSNYSKFIKGQYNVIGSLKNNSIKTNQSSKRFKFLFISEYRNKKDFGENPSWDAYFETEKKVVPYLYSFAERRNILLSICSNTFNYNEEKKFYSDLIHGNNWELLERKNDESSYNYIDMSEFIIFISTAIGYEAISRGSKVAALTVRSETTKIKSHKFGWPYHFEKNFDDFWINYFDKKKFDLILNNFLDMPKEKFLELVKIKYDYLLPFDPGNEKLIKKMRYLDIIK